MNEPIKVLVVDDDATARAGMIALLSRHPDLEVEVCGNGVHAIDRIRADAPDLVLLDVYTSSVERFDVVEAIGPERMPITIFISAEVELALHAFDSCALDYLLKPFQEERFRVALDRARNAVHARRWARDARLQALPLAGVAAPTYPAVIAIKGGNQFRFVSVADVDYVEADGNHSRLFIQKTQRVVHISLTEIAARLLDPAHFIRIHRSTIVNVQRINFVEPLFHGELSVSLKDGTKLTCSRRFRGRLHERVRFVS